MSASTAASSSSKSTCASKKKSPLVHKKRRSHSKKKESFLPNETKIPPKTNELSPETKDQTEDGEEVPFEDGEEVPFEDGKEVPSLTNQPVSRRHKFLYHPMFASSPIDMSKQDESSGDDDTVLMHAKRTNPSSDSETEVILVPSARRICRRTKVFPPEEVKIVRPNIPLSENFFSRLGKDLLLHLKSFLGCKFHLLAALNTMIKTIIYTLGFDLSLGYTSTELVPLLEKNPGLFVTSLNIIIADTLSLVYLYSHLPKLAKLCLSTPDRDVTLSNIDFAYRCKELKELTVECYVENIDVLSVLPSLTHVAFTDSTVKVQHFDFTPLSNLHNLQCLTLNVYHGNVRDLMVNFPFLREVTFICYEGKTPSFAGCSLLRSLSISLGDKIILSPLDNNVCLDTLHIETASSVGIEPTFTVPSLKKLILKGIVEDVDDLSFVGDCIELEYVQLESFSLKENTCFDFSRLTTLPRIATLNVSIGGIDLSSLAQMSSLQEAYIGHIEENNKSLLLPPPRDSYLGLTKLSLTHPQSQFSTDYLAACPNLVSLTINNFFSNKMPKIDLCAKLEVLCIMGNDLGSPFIFLSGWPELRELNVESRQLELKHLATCTKLEKLTITNSSFSTLEGLNLLPSLTSLKILTGSLRTTKGIRWATGLRLLYLECGYLDKFVVSRPLSCLQEIVIYGARELSTLDGLKNCPNVRKIQLIGSNLSDLFRIERLQHLKNLVINGDGYMTKLPDLSTCPSLTKVAFHSSPLLTDIRGLANCNNLTYLAISQSSLSNISALAKCPSLVTVYLADTEVKSLLPLGACKNLTKLTIMNNDKITDITPLSNCKQLAHLVLQNLPSLHYISKLSLCPRLRHLDFTGTKNLSDIYTLIFSSNTLTSLVHANGVKIDLLNPQSKKLLLQSLSTRGIIPAQMLHDFD